jgi:hypothetical protein
VGINQLDPKTMLTCLIHRYYIKQAHSLQQAPGGQMMLQGTGLGCRRLDCRVQTFNSMCVPGLQFSELTLLPNAFTSQDLPSKGENIPHNQLSGLNS